MKEVRFEKKDLAAHLGAVLFWLSAAVTLIFIICYAPVLIHSDVSSDMILGRAMVQGGKLMDSSWYHANALPVIDLLYLRGLLIEWTGNWALTRILMTVLLFSLMLLSCYYALRQMGFSRREFYYAGVLLLLICVCGVTFMQQYALGITYIYLALGLLFGCMNAWKGKNPEKKAFYPQLALLMLLMLATGLSSSRQSISVYLPLCMAAFFNLLSDTVLTARLRRDDRLWDALRESRSAKLLLLTIAMLLMSVVGVAMRVLLLRNRFHFVSSYGDMTAQADFFNRAVIALQSFFTTFGYAGRQNLITPSGLACLVAVAIVIALSIVTAAQWQSVRKSEADPPNMNGFILWTYACAMGVTLISMIFGGVVPDMRYFYFPLLFFAPVLASYMGKRNYRSLLLPGIGVLLAAACCANCILIACRAKNLADAENAQIKKAVEVLNYLQDEGYTDGFAPFWHASVNVERSNGEVFITPIDLSQDKANGSVHIYAKRWLSFSWAFENEYLSGGRKFFLLPKGDLMDGISNSVRDAILSGAPCALLDESEKIFENELYIAYALPTAIRCAKDSNELVGDPALLPGVLKTA